MRCCRHKLCSLVSLPTIVVLLGGCTTTIRVTDPPRTATEQFLLSQAAALAVEQLEIDPLEGHRVYVDSTFFAASEQAFVLGELRARLLTSGVKLTEARPDAEIVLEVRSGGVGIDRGDLLFGIPSMLVSSGDGGDGIARVPFATPEISIMKEINQVGVASVAFVAYRADSGEVVTASGPHIGRTFREDKWIFGSGPHTKGDIPTVEAVE